jgi:hypothetical protein
VPPVVNSFVLSILNISSILVGYWFFYITKSDNQIAVQVLSACIFNILSFLGWKIICRKHIEKLRLKLKKDLALTFLFSVVFGPLVFIPLHYITQGYLTSYQNILGIWMYQIPTNLLILMLYRHFSRILDLRKFYKENTQGTE